MIMSRNQKAGQNGNIQIGNKFFERVEQFIYGNDPNDQIPFMKKLRAD